VDEGRKGQFIQLLVQIFGVAGGYEYCLARCSAGQTHMLAGAEELTLCFVASYMAGHGVSVRDAEVFIEPFIKEYLKACRKRGIPSDFPFEWLWRGVL
jgi:hypothetical protein